MCNINGSLLAFSIILYSFSSDLYANVLAIGKFVKLLQIETIISLGIANASTAVSLENSSGLVV